MQAGTAMQPGTHPRLRTATVAMARAEFARPVDHVMRCDDFKSTFARKLSTRYTSTNASPHSPTPAPRIGNKTHIHDNVSTKIAPRTDLSESVSRQKEPGADNADVGAGTGVDAGAGLRLATLNIEVDTLRWQLAQTEANRQMHIALLRQVVSFLSRVKEHIECQKEERETMTTGEMSTSQTRSLLHLPASLVRTRTHAGGGGAASTAITCADDGTWSNPTLIFPSENDSNRKMSDEISRLVCLANTVLGTDLPELNCWCAERKERATTPAGRDTFDTTDTTPMKGYCAQQRTIGTAKLAKATPTSTTDTLNTNEKRNDYEQYVFMEDESGFSSMSSFQEIGIPIISIIPSSPSEEECACDAPAPAPAPSLEGDCTTTTATATATSSASTVHVFWV